MLIAVVRPISIAQNCSHTNRAKFGSRKFYTAVDSMDSAGRTSPSVKGEFRFSCTEGENLPFHTVLTFWAGSTYRGRIARSSRIEGDPSKPSSAIPMARIYRITFKPICLFSRIGVTSGFLLLSADRFLRTRCLNSMQNSGKLEWQFRPT